MQIVGIREMLNKTSKKTGKSYSAYVLYLTEKNQYVEGVEASDVFVMEDMFKQFINELGLSLVPLVLFQLYNILRL